MALIPYFELIKIPVKLYKMMGQDILKSKIDTIGKSSQSKYLKVLFYMGLINYFTQWSLELTFLILAIRSSSMLEITAVAPLVGYGLVGIVKQVTLHINKLKIQEVLEDLEDLFPTTRQLQEEYNLKSNVLTLTRVMKAFAGFCICNTGFFTLFPFGKSLLAMVVDGVNYDFPTAYPLWYPFELSANWFVYIICCSLQFWVGSLAGIATMTADLFLVTSLGQLCIQFEFISKKLSNYEPRVGKEAHQFLREILKLHVKCLELSDTVDEVFNFSLLLNFLTSSGTICFVGFQVISSPTKEDIMKFGVLLPTLLAQVMIICFYGNKLIDASLAVGDAAYDHPWYKGDVAYKKMVALVICRSQKYAAIHAPTFPPISLQTFMKVISMSYQFFAVLQTTYDNQ